MKRMYNIEIVETCIRNVEFEAESEHAAIVLAQEYADSDTYEDERYLDNFEFSFAICE